MNCSIQRVNVSPSAIPTVNQRSCSKSWTYHSHLSWMVKPHWIPLEPLWTKVTLLCYLLLGARLQNLNSVLLSPSITQSHFIFCCLECPHAWNAGAAVSLLDPCSDCRPIVILSSCWYALCLVHCLTALLALPGCPAREQFWAKSAVPVRPKPWTGPGYCLSVLPGCAHGRWLLSAWLMSNPGLLVQPDGKGNQYLDVLWGVENVSEIKWTEG